ncbi:MAG: hypothetical protein ACOVJ8_03660 [Sediminibacterium sp.]
MKKILTAILILTVFTASAQKPGAPPNIEERLKKTKEILSKELQLNASQLNTTTEAFNKFFKKADLLLKGTTPPPSESQGKQIQGFEKERDQKILSILNESQGKRYKEIVLKMRPPKPGQGNQQGPPPQK